MTTAFRRQVRVFIDSELSPEARSARFAAYAQQATADLIAAGRAPPRYREFVDGVEGASPLGAKRTISDQFAFTGDAALATLAFLRGRVPVGRGTLRDSFIVAVDGRPFAASVFDPAKVPASATVLIFSPVPYERKADVQLAGRRVLKFSVAAGMLNDAVREIKGRFGNSVRVSRVYSVNVPAGYILKRGRDRGTPVQTPGIQISPIE